jgi:uncharacterized Zn finger protein
VAVRIDVEAFRESLPPAVAKAAEQLRQHDGLGDLEPVGGGVHAPVRTPATGYRPWVGIVDGNLTGRCTCPDTGDDLCAHAAAVVLAAVAEGIPFSPTATPPDTEPDGADRAAYVEAVRRLTPDQLTDLIAANAMRDDRFAAQLLSAAGMRDPADHLTG